MNKSLYGWPWKNQQFLSMNSKAFCFLIPLVQLRHSRKTDVAVGHATGVCLQILCLHALSISRMIWRCEKIHGCSVSDRMLCWTGRAYKSICYSSVIETWLKWLLDEGMDNNMPALITVYCFITINCSQYNILMRWLI